MAAAGGLLSAMIVNQLIHKKADLTMALNGALGGLVSITAEPLAPMVWQAILIGAAGGVLAFYGVKLLDKLKIDDVVGAIPVHLICGIFGTLVVPITNADATLKVQVIGVVSIATFTIIASLIAWLAIRYTIGIRVDMEDEAIGIDNAETGMSAYPYFVLRGGQY